MECRVKKISKRCGCAPWFIPRNKNTRERDVNSINNLPVCTIEGTECFEEKSKNYNEDLLDRTECDCKNDCEIKILQLNSTGLSTRPMKYFSFTL